MKTANKKPTEPIKDHKGNVYKTTKEMCDAYGIAFDTFKKRMQRGRYTLEEALTLKVQEINNQWSEDEIKILKAKYPDHGTNIPELNRTRSSIHAKVVELGLQHKKRREQCWTEKEITILKEKYPTYGANIPELNRGKDSIHNKARYLGIKSLSCKRWTQEEIELLKTQYPTYGSQIPELDRPAAVIQSMAARLGIKAESSIEKRKNIWTNNIYGLKIKLVDIVYKNSSANKRLRYYKYEFEDRTITTCVNWRGEQVAHPLLVKKQIFSGFSVKYIETDTTSENWNAYYKCECKKCGLKAIYTPYQMMGHQKQCI